ncbi:MAG: hypothetical protein JWM27_2161 [Gemmatimonadetes bacterium]|nr:hypothetical protein [Gemmatimonadota bacterium]
MQHMHMAAVAAARGAERVIGTGSVASPRVEGLVRAQTKKPAATSAASGRFLALV